LWYSTYFVGRMPSATENHGVPIGRPTRIHLAKMIVRQDRAWALSDHPKPANEYHLKTGQREMASGTLIPAEACRLRGHGQGLERREETTSPSAGTAGLVAAAHPGSEQNPSRNRQRLPESSGDCSASAQWLGAVRAKTGQRSDHRLSLSKTSKCLSGRDLYFFHNLSSDAHFSHVSPLHSAFDLRSRAALELENLALRHQIGVLQRSARKRPRLTPVDRLLWVLPSRMWTDWRSALAMLQPETVIAWHRAGFRLFWNGRSLPARSEI